MTVGVAVALYNGSKFIRIQLDSIRNQTLAPDRVIMCDDGSVDGTVDIVRAYIEEYNLQDKWQIIVNKCNLGYARNFYKAMKLCQTDLIFLCDQDDIWCNNKIEKMTEIMKNHDEISVLASKFGMIDADGNVMHGLLEKKSKETGEIKNISHEDLLKAFYWPGMLMCVRNTFFCEIYDLINEHTVAHDRVLAHFAAEKSSFYEYDYIGAYHRRHNNNTAKEEHRVFKLLNLQRKLRDMKDFSDMLRGLLNISLPFSEDNINLLRTRLELAELREKAVQTRDLKLLQKLYKNNSLLRTVSYICDIWLIVFGK